MDQPDQSEASVPEARRILVVITGGTICMQNSRDGLVPTANFVDNCLRPNSNFNDGSTQDPTPVINEYGNIDFCPTLRMPNRSKGTPDFVYSILEFSDLIDSSSMDAYHWNKIIKCLQNNWSSFNAFVILHGTDTLAYTASASAFMLKHPLEKTVIITGSQLSMYAPDSDAPGNLLHSLSMAGGYLVPEVSVVFHHKLWRATRVTKVSSFDLAAFTTPNSAPLAMFPEEEDADRPVEILSDSIKPALGDDAGTKTGRPQSLIRAFDLDTSRVAILKIYPGIASAWVDGMLRGPGLGGIVIETFGAGNIPVTSPNSNLLNILARAVSRGIVVVSVTQCLTGSVSSAYESARKMERTGILAGLDMTTEAAYTKLVYLLGERGLSREDIRNKMMENLRDELSADSMGRPILRPVPVARL